MYRIQQGIPSSHEDRPKDSGGMAKITSFEAWICESRQVVCPNFQARASCTFLNSLSADGTNPELDHHHHAS